MAILAEIQTTFNQISIKFVLKFHNKSQLKPHSKQTLKQAQKFQKFSRSNQFQMKPPAISEAKVQSPKASISTKSTSLRKPSSSSVSPSA
jgi:hypothetical protein